LRKGDMTNWSPLTHITVGSMNCSNKNPGKRQ
jgi:hypothetical protein